jgi:osmotically-inducible protein OsmY
MEDFRTDDVPSRAGILVEESPPSAKAARSAAEVEPQIAHLAQRIRNDVREQTFGGVRDLEVRISAQGVVLRGRCSSFYCKQLAQHAAMGLAGPRRLVNEIEVW